MGWDAAKAIGKLVEPDEVLLKKNHAVIKVEYKYALRDGLTLTSGRYYMFRSSSVEFSLE